MKLADNKDLKNPRLYKTDIISYAFNDILEDDKVYYVAVGALDADGLASPFSTTIPLQQMGKKGIESFREFHLEFMNLKAKRILFLIRRSITTSLN